MNYSNLKRCMTNRKVISGRNDSNNKVLPPRLKIENAPSLSLDYFTHCTNLMLIHIFKVKLLCTSLYF